LPINPFSVPVGFSFHFLWGDQLHFHKVHYVNGLFGGEALVTPIITIVFISNYRLFY
jgi:hypothetical protein